MTVRRLAFALALIVAAALAAADETRHFLWRVTSPTTTLYVAGSVHVLRETDLPLPPALDAAYAGTRRLVLEVDPASLDPARVQAYAQSVALLPPGKRLDDVLTKRGYRQFVRRARALDLPVSLLAPLEPWFAALTALSVEMHEHGYDGARGVDRLLAERALADGRPVAGLETLEAQLGAFDGLPPALQERFLLDTLEDLGKLERSLDALIDAWKRGDVERMERMQRDGLQSVPEFYARVIADRHAAWLPQIETMLAGGEPTLVVVGAQHLVGPDSLVKRLAERGYAVERL